MLYRKIESKNNQDFNTNPISSKCGINLSRCNRLIASPYFGAFSKLFQQEQSTKNEQFTKIYIRCNSCTDSYGNSVWVGIHVLGDLWHCFTHLKWSDRAGMFNNLWKKEIIDGVSINHLIDPLLWTSSKWISVLFSFASLSRIETEHFTFKLPTIKQKNLEASSLSSQCLLLTLM